MMFSADRRRAGAVAMGGTGTKAGLGRLAHLRSSSRCRGDTKTIVVMRGE